MDRTDVTSGAAFKAALRGTLAFGIVLVIGSFIAMNYFKQGSRDILTERVTTNHQFMTKIYTEGGKGEAGRKALLDLVAQLGSSDSDALQEVSLFDSNGKRLIGNLEAPPATLGWREKSLPISLKGSATGPQEAVYLLYSEQLDDMVLEVGYRLDGTLALEKTFLETIWGFGLLLAATFLAIGYFTSLASLRKLQAMTATLDRVSQGDGQVRLAVSAQNDQIDRVSRAMNVNLDRLSILMATTRASAAAIAHDLRTPLSRAFLAVDRAQTLLDKGEDARGGLDEIEAELTRLRSIFDVILRISRLEQDKGLVGFSAVPLAPLLIDLAETFAPLAEDRGQTLTLSPVAANVAVPGDVAMLAQLVANLIQNAISHCPPGTAITLGAAAAKSEVRLWVTDTGPGIPEAEREKVFELFYRVDPNRTGGGNGLGMALVKAMTERLGGRITLSDAMPGLHAEVVFPATSGAAATLSKG